MALKVVRHRREMSAAQGERGLTAVVCFLLLSMCGLSSAISVPSGICSPQWHTLLPNAPESRVAEGIAGERQWRFGPLHLGQHQRVCVAKANEPQKKEEFGLKAAFQKLPEVWQSPVINAWASILAGLVAYTIATPIEAFKVGIQTWPGSTLGGIGRNIIKSRGPLGFFNGLDAMLWAGLPYSIVMYGCYQPVKQFVNDKMRDAGVEPGAMGQILGATIAETLGMIVFIPGELVRMRMMNNPGRYSSFIQAVPAIIGKEGGMTMFRGFGTTLARDIPYTCLTFVIFEAMRTEFSRRNAEGSVSFTESMVAGVLTAMICSTCTIPLDVVKSNVMTSMAAKCSMTAVARDIFVTSGVGGFFKGFFPFMAINSFKWSSSMAVYATAYEHYGGGSMGAAVH